MIARLPIRVRLTLAFTTTLVLLVTALGALVYTRHAAGLNDAIDQGLAARAAELGPLEARDPGLLSRAHLAEPDETLEAILDPDGHVVDATPNAAETTLAAAVQRADTKRGDGQTEAALPGFDHAVRVLAVPAGGGRIAVAGTALADRDEALAELRRELLLALPFVIGGCGAAVLRVRRGSAAAGGAHAAAGRDDQRRARGRAAARAAGRR